MIYFWSLQSTYEESTGGGKTDGGYFKNGGDSGHKCRGGWGDGENGWISEIQDSMVKSAKVLL